MQIFRGAGISALALALATSCAQEETRVSLSHVRFDLPANATKAVVLGTADHPFGDEALPGTQRPRRSTSLALVVPSDQRLFVVDPGVEVLAQLADVLVPPELHRPSDARPVDGVLLSCADPDAIAGIPLLAAGFDSVRPLPVYCAQLHRKQIEQYGSCAAEIAGGRIALVDLTTGVPTTLSASLTVTARTVWSAGALVLRFEGAKRALLYAPRLGRIADLAPPLRTQLADAGIALLDGARRGDDPIDEVLRLTETLPPGGRTLLFLRLVPGDPLLDSKLPERDRLRRRGADLAEDGSEFWL